MLASEISNIHDCFNKCLCNLKKEKENRLLINV